MTSWTDIAGPLIKLGAPTIGTVLGGPLGGALGGVLGEVLGGALGVPATPDAVNDALKNAPADLQGKLSAAEAEAIAKWPALAEMAKSQAENAVAVGETMRAEIVAEDPMQRWWRPIYAFELTAECALVWPAIIYDLMFGDGKLAPFITQNAGLLMTYWGFRFSVLGVYTYGRTQEKREEIKNAPSLTPDLINQIIKVLKRK